MTWDIRLFDRTADAGVVGNVTLYPLIRLTIAAHWMMGQRMVIACSPLGDGVKLALIFLHDERDGDSVGGAEG